MYLIRSLTKERKNSLSTVLAIFFLILIIYYISQNIEDFRSLEIANANYILMIVLSIILRIYATGMIMDTSLRPLGVNLKRIESFGLATITRFINQISPGKVGLLARATYLKNNHKLNFSKFISSIAAAHIILYVISAIIGLLSLLSLRLNNYTISYIFDITLLCILLLLLVLFLIPDTAEHKRISKIISGWKIIKNDKSTVIKVLAWSILFVFFSGLIMYGTFNSIGAEITFMVALFFGSINVVNSVIAITPSGFGISEGVIVILAQSIGISVSEALAAALLQRLITFAVVLLIAPYFTKTLLQSNPIELLKSKAAG